MTRKLALVAAFILALGALVAGIAIAAGGGDGTQAGNPPASESRTDDDDGPGEAEDSDESLTGSPAERAGAAALAATGGGTLLEVERGDDGASAYEVEIRRADGSVAEVLLDRSFNVLRTVAGDDD